MSKIRLTHRGNNIVLVGHMGSGKTSIGRNLSKKISYKFIDIDEEIERNISMNISKFFENKGEKEFRKLEEETASKFIKNNNKSIIALGGGSLENKKIRDLVLKDNFSIWLKCNLKTLTFRCNNRSSRPMLKGKNIRKELSRLDKYRKKNYMMSDLIIDVSKKTKSPIVQEIIDFLKV